MSMLTNNEIAEQSVIGSILVEPGCLPEVEEYITEADFGNVLYRAVFTAAEAMWAELHTIDPVLIRSKLESEFDGTELTNTLTECIEYTPTAANAVEYAKIVRNCSRLRKIQRIGMEMAASMAGDDWVTLAADSITQLTDLQNGDTHTDLLGGENWSKVFLEREHKTIKDPTMAYIRTGISSLDLALGGGMFRGGMYIVGARPGMGKTTLALNIAEEVATHGTKVLFVSLEMSDHQIMCKRISRETGIPYTSLMSGHMESKDISEMDTVTPMLAQRPLMVNTKTGLTVSDINLLINKAAGCQFCVVDYLGLVRPTRPTNVRYEDYTNISGELKQLAKKLDIPIMVLSQLNRQNTGRQDKRPQLSDLRDTGAVEQDADAVILLHRAGYYKRDPGEAAPDQEEIELIVAKNRHGNTGTTKLAWSGECGRVAAYDYRFKEGDYL